MELKEEKCMVKENLILSGKRDCACQPKLNFCVTPTIKRNAQENSFRVACTYHPTRKIMQALSAELLGLLKSLKVPFT